MKIGYYGVREVSEKLCLNKHTVRRGKRELLSENLLPCDKIRKSGGGRKKVDTIVNIFLIFTTILENYTAGNPMKSQVSWTNLSCVRLRNLLKDCLIDVSVNIVKQLLKQCGYVKRKLYKNRTLKVVEDRNEQFEHIALLKEKFEQENQVIL